MSRVAWIDITKGLAICLVVVGHALGGALARGWVELIDAGRMAYEYIYSFHMPVFFIISGALAIDSIRANRARALLSRLGSVAWPYMLWGILFVCIEPVVSRFMLSPPERFVLSDAVIRLLIGDTSWFLWTLFLAQCILITVSRLPMLAVIVVTIPISLVTAGYEIGTVGALIHYMPFVAVGALIGRRLFDANVKSAALAILIGVLLFCSLGVLIDYNVHHFPGGYLLCGVIGSIACFMVAQSIAEFNLGRVLAIAGEASLVVFLLHPYFQGAARELIMRTMGITAAWWQIAIPAIAGVVGPALVWWLSERYGFRWLFRLDLPNLLMAPAIKQSPEIIGS